MVGYLKDRLTFKTYKKVEVLSDGLDLVYGSIYDTSSSATIQEELDVSLGDFFVFNDFIGVVTASEPSKGTTRLTIGGVATIFDRQLLYDFTTLTAETFLSKSIRDNYVESGDTVFDRSYIQIKVTSSTSFIEPLYEDYETYYLYDIMSYIKYIQRVASIYTEFTYTNDNLIITIGKKQPNTINIIFDGIGYYLSSENYSQDSVSKISAYSDGYTYTYYLLKDDTFTDIYPDKKDRAEGIWIAINATSPIDFLSAVCTNPDVSVSCDPDLFKQLGFNTGTYTFRFDGETWRFDNGTPVELSDIGISVSGDVYKNDVLYATFKLKGNLEDDILNEFSSHSHSHSIEFYSVKKINYFDKLNIKLRDKIFTSYASEVVFKGTDNRYFVKSGEMSTKLTEKLSSII